MVIMERFETWEDFKPHAHWHQEAMVMPHIFLAGWKTENGVFCLANTTEHIWLSSAGDITVLEYAKILLEAASLGHVVTQVSLPVEIAKQLNFQDSRDVTWMRRTHPFPPKSVSKNVTVINDDSCNAEIQRLLQLSAPDLSTWPGNNEIMFWVVARNPDNEIVAASAGVQWQTGAYVISSVVVADSARRQGYGSLVTLTTAQELFARGASVVNLGVRTSNRGALAMYQAIGFDEQFDFTRALIKSKD
jgi:ribosomal protein S18 acetylase RimI-like enzyme